MVPLTVGNPKPYITPKWYPLVLGTCYPSFDSLPAAEEKELPPEDIKGILLGTPNREPQEYSRNIMEYKDPGRYIPITYLLYSWGSLCGVPSRVPLDMCREVYCGFLPTGQFELQPFMDQILHDAGCANPSISDSVV